METKLKKLLRKRKISQKKLYDKIAKKYETPIGQYALSEIVNGKKLNYHIITLIKICQILKVKPNSIVEIETLDNQLLKPKYVKSNKKEEPSVLHDGMKYNPENPKETLEFTDEQEFITRKNKDVDPDYEF